MHKWIHLYKKCVWHLISTQGYPYVEMQSHYVVFAVIENHTTRFQETQNSTLVVEIQKMSRNPFFDMLVA